MMRLTWWGVLALVGMSVVGGFLIGRAGTGATATERAELDSLRLQHRRTDVAVAAARQAQAREDSVAADSIRHAKQRVIVLQAGTDTAWLPLDTATVTAPLRTALDNAHAAQRAERAGDSALIAKLALDTTQLRRHADSAWAMVDTVTAQRDRARQDYADAVHRRREPPVTLGATGGGSCVWAMGRMQCGPGATAGLTVRLKLHLPRWLGG